jgi:hypothetical protein
MPLKQSSSDEAVGDNIRELKDSGHPHKQSIAIALSVQRRAKGEPEPEIGKAENVYQMGAKEAMEEHVRLIKVLASPGHKDDLEELEHQKKEMPEIEEAVSKSETFGGEPNHEPTEGQKKANNYAHGHWKIHGLDISIENLMGSTRKGTTPSGEPWEVAMPYHYGYIKKTTGADGDHLDVAIGPVMEASDEAHIINQKNPETGEFDEHKVFVGFATREDAIRAFRAGRSDNPDDVMGSVITIPIDELKRWIAEGCLEDEAVLKAEHTAHIKAHYRTVNGKVTYIPGYDKTIHGDAPEATLHERTVLGLKGATGYLRATDADDRKAILDKAKEMGVEHSHVKRSGANHHGRVGAYDVIHFKTGIDAVKVQAALKGAEPTLEGGQKADTGPTEEELAAKKKQETLDKETKAWEIAHAMDKIIAQTDAAILSEKEKYGYIKTGKAAYLPMLIAYKKKLKAFEDGDIGSIPAVEASIHHYETESAKAQKTVDYLSADLPAILTEAANTSNPALYKLAAVISALKAKAEMTKKGGSHEDAKNFWVAAASYATLAKKG